MQINTYNKCDFDSISLEKPVKEEDYYFSKLNFVIQTPKLNINKINSKNITLNVNEQLDKLLNSFDKKIIELISEHSENYFEEKFSFDEAEDIYKNSIKFKKDTNNVFTSIISKKNNIFNKHKETMEIRELTKNDSVICLIKCTKVIFYRTYCMPIWETVQIKYKEQILDTKSYLFKEDSSDNYKEEEIDEDLNLKLIKINN